MKRTFTKILILCLSVFLLVGCFAAWYMNRPQTKAAVLSVVDVGQGDCSVFFTPDGHCVMIDAGPDFAESDLRAYMKNHGIQTVDYLFLTHLHDDHIGGADMILREFEVLNIVFCDSTDTSPSVLNLYAALADACATGKTERIQPESGNVFCVGDAKITVLYAPTIDSADNNASLFLRIDYFESSFLLSGDAEAEEEREVLNAVDGTLLQADFLKVSHHGASTSTTPEYLQAVSPSVAAISVGVGNSYSHPHMETLLALRDASVEVYRTDTGGTLTFLADGKSVYIKP